MNKITILFLAIAIVACKPNPKKEDTKDRAEEVSVEAKKKFPEALEKVFMAHRGLEAWKNQQTLTYDLPKTDFTETHTIDLWSRKDRVDAENFSLGFDGKEVWLLDDENIYRGDAGFYHNLMFYFYAMPFVLADDGIIYSETENLIYGDKAYPGIRISYESGVGASSKDEYFIHYNPDNYQIEWLGYTVTYRSGEASDNIKWIRYDDWQTVEGLVLPKSITWYNLEDGKILDASNKLAFENVSLSVVSKPDSFYAKPEGAKFVEVKKN
ncbi:hypothetical protein HME9304_00324 [Flagellimonas maritima]|uniref:Threonine synthase n=1 Tax=Flagellimonas maritima TaxID=1383885 RepID=A0A2Z4LNH5_9FLAO|nr:DUF6503 family protein [Allomuricauda aurantiaca]AWX43336.1 hypothetical protein HME9304_00324 [Allomuricauda aurantiaca]